MPTESLNSAIPPYSAVVLGSTGNVGRQIVKLLAASTSVKQVTVLNRRPANEFGGLSKVREIVVPDMNHLAGAVAAAARETDATIGLCAIGVGKGTRQMSEAAVRTIEVQYPEAFAEGCKAGGVLSLGLLTAAGADIKSSIRYVRIIGEKEQVVIRVGVPALGLYKPSVIFGNSNTPSYLQYLFPAVQWLMPSRFHAIHTTELARAMVEGTQRALAGLHQARGDSHSDLPRPAVRSYEYSDMKPLFDTDGSAY
jgi:uncharacterized protein YbjT (DUF2867 family)